MELKRFAKYLIENDDQKELDDVVTDDEKAIPRLTLIKHGGNHPKLPSALSFNGKNMYYSFDLTNICNRNCPACYVDRAKETGCNAVAPHALKEYKGDIRRWEHDAKTDEEKTRLQKTKDLVNANGGIRMFSAADYPVIENFKDEDDFYAKILKSNGINDPEYFRKEVKSFLDDAHQYGWHVKAITKELKFVKDHVDHPAIKGINISMNSHGYGVPHETVRSLKSGESLKKLGIDHTAAHKIGKHSDKIIGRTVTFTPFDLETVLNHMKKGTDDHIGVITSGHDVPGNGVRYVPSVPKKPSSPKKIIIQSNFPESIMHLLNGDKGASLTKGQIGSLKKAGHIVEAKEENPTKYRNVVTLLHLNDKGDIVPYNEFGTWKEVVGIYHEKDKLKAITPDHIKGGATANIVDDIVSHFEKDNPEFTYKFSKSDAELLTQKTSGKMCCAGEDEEGPASGKCTTCKAKCGVKGCGIAGKVDISSDHLAHLLNDYAKKYNELRTTALNNLKQGKLEVSNLGIKEVKPEKESVEKTPSEIYNYRIHHGHEIDKMNVLKKEIKKHIKKKNVDMEHVNALQDEHDKIKNKIIKETTLMFIDILEEVSETKNCKWCKKSYRFDQEKYDDMHGRMPTKSLDFCSSGCYKEWSENQKYKHRD